MSTQVLKSDILLPCVHYRIQDNPPLSILEAILLGIVQGAAEFLPISSSGHLVLVPWWLGWDDPPIVFDVAVHVGTTVAILIYFWRDWVRILQGGLHSILNQSLDTTEARLFWFLVVGSIPVGVIGILLSDYFDSTFSDPAIVGTMLIVTAGILVFSEQAEQRSRALADMQWQDAILIGAAQALAIMPGISRSGSTIAAGLLRGIQREEAARYSFLLATPVILGAGGLQVLDVLTGEQVIDDDMVTALIVGFVSSAVVGYLCIILLLQLIRRRRLYGFAAYCAIFGGISLAAALLQ